MTDKNIIRKNFTQTIGNTVREFGMLAKGDWVLAAVSGGPDSVALVLSLLALKDEYNLKIGIAHVNHQLRGDDAQKDEAFSKDLAKKHSLPFYNKQKDVKAYAKDHGLSLENAGRKVRYDFFKKTAQENSYTKIATGHHKDDNAELVLINLLRGSGTKGLCGIPPVRDKNIIRPLIQVSKNEIQEFLKAYGQDSMIDESNLDPQYLRNRIRHQLIPHLMQEYNPEITNALDRLSHILRKEENFWEIQTRESLFQCIIEESQKSIVLSKPKMANLDPALFNRVIRKAIEKIKTNLKQISHLHISSITEFCFNQISGTSLDLPGQIRLYKTNNTITIKKENIPLREIGKKEKLLKRRTMNPSKTKSLK